MRWFSFPFKNPIKQHTSQTYRFALHPVQKFKNPIKQHTSQTYYYVSELHKQFKNPIKQHTSQTCISHLSG